MSAISSSSDPEQRRRILIDLPAEIRRGEMNGLSFGGKSSLFPEQLKEWEPETGGSAIRPGGSLSACFESKGVIPVSNTGIKLTGVEEGGAQGSLDGVAYPVHIDYLTFTLSGFYLDHDIKIARNWVERWSGELFTIGGLMDKHFSGYYQCWEIVYADGLDSGGKMLGWVGVSHVSDHQKGKWCFSLTGTGASLIEDWSKLVNDVQQMNSRITRCDIALDDYYGDHPLSEVESLYEAGAFNTGGRSPNLQKITNSNGSGNTYNVGTRDSGKTYRAYEKGRQLIGKGRNIEDSLLAWVRHEFEVHGKNGRVVPWEVLLKPAEYLKGAFPKAFSWMEWGFISINVVKKKAQLGLVKLFEHGRQQIGKLVNYCRDYLNLDALIILDRLAGKPGFYPASLLETMRLDYLPWPDDEDEVLNLCGW